ncbi:MAG: hypothetical protein GY842_28155 [bacterium]|nr:hypothetical protein [bacterium]
MQELIDRYRQLVVAEESVETLNRALALVEDVLGIRVRWTQRRLEAFGITDKGRPDEVSIHMTERLRALDFPELAQVGGRRRRTQLRQEQQALAVRTAVTLAVVLALTDEIRPPLPEHWHSLLVDACLIVFHQAYFALLPELGTRGWEDEQRLLTESFPRFAQHIPRVSDRYTVLALYHDAAGEWERAARFYREALLATHSDDHEFMTTLQTCWSFCIEHQMFHQAFDLLLESHSRIARQDLDEVRELMALTFGLQQSFYEAKLGKRAFVGQPGTTRPVSARRVVPNTSRPEWSRVD